MKTLFFFFFSSVFLFATNKIYIRATISPHLNSQLKLDDSKQNGTLYLQGNSNSLVISMPQNTSLNLISTIGSHPTTLTKNISKIIIDKNKLTYQKKSLIFTISVK